MAADHPDAARSERLTLEPDPWANEDEFSRLHFYESSLTHTTTGERLLSLATRGPGMRLTVAQARALRDWIGEWLDA